MHHHLCSLTYGYEVAGIAGTLYQKLLKQESPSVPHSRAFLADHLSNTAVSYVQMPVVVLLLVLLARGPSGESFLSR